MFFHGTIRSYTSGLIDLFNDFVVQYKNSAGVLIEKKIPLQYASKEKSRLFDKYTSEQLLSGNYSVLPRGNLSLVAIIKAEQRITNKNNKINTFRTPDTLQYAFNSVPYEFTYELTFKCRGMNEVSQIIEQIVPNFNPNANIDIWDAQNLNTPTRVPIKLLDIGFEDEEYAEYSSNIFTLTVSISLIGNIYQPIKSLARIKEVQMSLNEIEGNYFSRKELINWDVDGEGKLINKVIDVDIQPGDYFGDQ